MKYIIKLINGDKIEVSEDAYKAILAKINRDPKSPIVLGSGEYINPSSISNIVRADKDVSQIDRTKQLEGVTPDGEHVIKRFGQWYIANPASPYQFNEKGESILRYDGHPLLPTPEEYEERFKQLPASTWPQLLVGQSSDLDDRLLVDRSNRITGGGFERIEAPNLTLEDMN